VSWHSISIYSRRLIRISIQKDKSPTVVVIDGRLALADLDEVQRVRQSLPGIVALDLDGLDACADEGLILLREWLNSGAQLVNAAPFLRMVLEGAKGLPPRNKA
jgi:hypothetical protein